MVNSFSDGLVLTAIYYSNESYVRIVPDDPNLIRSYTFMIEVENHEPYLTSTFGPYTLNVTCDNNFILSDMILAINGSSQT